MLVVVVGRRRHRHTQNKKQEKKKRFYVVIHGAGSYWMEGGTENTVTRDPGVLVVDHLHVVVPLQCFFKIIIS